MHKLFAAAVLLLLAAPAHAVVVGVLDKPGDSITAPLAFGTTLNTTLTVDGGLQFALASPGNVKLEILAGTQNIQLVAGAVGDVFGVATAAPLSVFSGDLKQGLHPFAVSALATGGVSAVVYRLSVTPVPASLVLLATGVAGLAALRRRAVSP